jgi:hypothetical protein
MSVSSIIESNLAQWRADAFARGDKDQAAKKIMTAYETDDTELDLTGLALTRLPTCLGELKNLQDLFLDCNHLESLPCELGKLPKLRLLSLCYNRELNDLPSTLGKLPELQAILTGSTSIKAKRWREITGRNSAMALQDQALLEKDKFCPQDLLFSQRPPEVIEKIDAVHQKLMRGTSWGYSGDFGFYDLLNFNEEDVIAQRIENASPNKKDLYFIDLGAGHFRWVDAVSSFLRRKYSEAEHHFHVIGVTGEREPFDSKTTVGNVTTHKISGFKLENLLESFAQFDLQLVNSVELIVTSWTLCHLVDPLGTLEQAYHLLNCGNGFLFGTGFVSSCFDERSSMSRTLSLAFGRHSYIARRTDSRPDSFALFRSKDTKYSFAKSHFRYDKKMPIMEFPWNIDSFASCIANLKTRYSESFDTNFGGNFHGDATDVLEELLGQKKKTIHYHGQHFQMPLFRNSLDFCRLYLDSFGFGGAYEVQLREKNKHKNTA